MFIFRSRTNEQRGTEVKQIRSDFKVERTEWRRYCVSKVSSRHQLCLYEEQLWPRVLSFLCRYDSPAWSYRRERNDGFPPASDGKLVFFQLYPGLMSCWQKKIPFLRHLGCIAPVFVSRAVLLKRQSSPVLLGVRDRRSEWTDLGGGHWKVAETQITASFAHRR